MGCPVDFSGLSISYACGELSSGGLKTVYLCDRQDLADSGTVAVAADGVVTLTVTTDVEAELTNGLLTLGFNNKDAFSNFTDVKTVNADGSAAAVPTIQLEFVRMDPAKRTALEEVATPGAEMVAFVETAAGTYHMVGYDFGLYAGTVDGASGASRTDKNRYQLTLVGEENVLAYTLTSTEWAKIKN